MCLMAALSPLMLIRSGIVVVTSSLVNTEVRWDEDGRSEATNVNY